MTGGVTTTTGMPTGSMRAARFSATPDGVGVRVERVGVPRAPRGDEVLVRVAASSVNGTDLGPRGGRVPVALLGRLLAPGFDLAGEVVTCGPLVTAFEPGDRVLALLGHAGGGQAEFALLPQGRAARVPASLPLEVAAAVPLAGLTALQALYGTAGTALRPGSAVLVNGATGGIGAFAVQLAKRAGATVTAVGSGRKLPFARGLGADAVVDYHEQDVTALDERFDVVLDAAGTLAFAAVRHLLAPGGVVVTTRVVGPDAPRAIASKVLARRGRFRFVTTAARPGDLAHLAAMAADGRLVVPVDRVLDLDDVEEAHRYAAGPAQGKVVVRIART